MDDYIGPKSDILMNIQYFKELNYAISIDFGDY
jgi:hypothetical protein